ncbi:hypothetical protein Bca4012_018703 [Brassica carinata]|uniref:Uncharacterized protein n=1 Tax=Brassica carinata TaxID=52824 RepID=A0A8X7WKC2_BRACI|nr:hypothetical protein Bca52824_003011 [Brassica carinata]
MGLYYQGCSPYLQLICVGCVKDLISFEAPLTTSHWNLNSISKQSRLQPGRSEALRSLSDAYSHTPNFNEYNGNMLKFLPVTSFSPRHRNVKVRSCFVIKLHCPKLFFESETKV